MAETGGLENRIPGNRDEGSNPSPSAMYQKVDDVASINADQNRPNKHVVESCIHTVGWILLSVYEFPAVWKWLGPVHIAKRRDSRRAVELLRTEIKPRFGYWQKPTVTLFNCFADLR